MQTPIRMMEADETQASSVSEPLPLLAFVNALLRHRKRIVAIVFVLCGVTGILTLAKTREYISTAAFSLQGADSHRISGIAAQFGLAVSAAPGNESPEYYMELLGSRKILMDAVATHYSYPFKGKVKSGNLISIYEIDKGDSATRYEAAVRALRSAISTNKSRVTGIVTVGVAAESPILAQQLLTRLIGLLNEFNLKTRQSQAANERRFVEARMAEISVNLRAAEDRLQSFLQRNRGGYSNIPELSFEHERLAREVQLRQQVYTSLAQSYEQARIDEVRDTPALTMVESPNVPVYPAPRGVVRRVFIAMILGLLIGIVPILIKVLFSAKRRPVEEEIEEFRKLRNEIRLWPRARQTAPPFTAREA